MKYELQINEIPFQEISFNGWVNNTLLGEPLFKESVEKDNLIPTKTVREQQAFLSGTFRLIAIIPDC